MNWRNENPASGRPGAKACAKYVDQLYLLAADELGAAERTEIEKHTESCAECAAALAEHRELIAKLEAAPRLEPSADVLAGCRARLTDALDQAEAAADRGLLGRWLDAILPRPWLSLHPVTAAALLLVLGFAAGVTSPRWMNRTPRPNTPAVQPSPDSATTTSEPSYIPTDASNWNPNDQELRNADVTGINWVAAGGDAPPQVEVQLNARRPVLLQGTIANDDVKRVLLNVLRNDQRHDADVRIESVELLGPRAKDADVGRALCQIVHNDHNAAVRLKALETLDAGGPQELVTETLEDALVQDANPGVRIEAINALRAMASKGQLTADPHLVDVLRSRAEKDSSTYIRLQSAAMIQDLGPREKF